MVQVKVFVRAQGYMATRFLTFSSWKAYTSWLLDHLQLWRGRGLVKRAYRSAPTALTDLTEVSLRKGNLEFFAREVA